MVKILPLVIMLFGVLYVNALPSGARVRRGFNNSGRGSDSGGEYFNQGSNERDASVSHEDREGCISEENNDSREYTYGYGRDDNQNEHNRSRGRGRWPS